MSLRAMKCHATWVIQVDDRGVSVKEIDSFGPFFRGI